MSTTSKQYVCKTQDGLVPTFGVAPSSHLDSNDSHDQHSIVLGIGSIVPRWDVVKQPNRKLQYFVRKDTFPTSGAAQFAASAFQQAADEWNQLGLGLAITPTNDQALANFYLRYEEGESGDTTYAMAFFPNEADQDVIVYQFAFDPSSKAEMKNVFLHELGHVLGLRHEFGVKRDPDLGLGPEGEGAVQFMQENPASVMNYYWPPTIQQSDIEGTKAFYKLKNGYVVNGSPVTDYMPQIRKRVSRNAAAGTAV